MKKTTLLDTVDDHDRLTKPEWIRLPTPGARCRYTGLSRSTLNELVIPGPANDHLPPVRSAVIKKRGATRGIRLVDFDSLMSYIDSLAHDPVDSVQTSDRKVRVR